MSAASAVSRLRFESLIWSQKQQTNKFGHQSSRLGHKSRNKREYSFVQIIFSYPGRSRGRTAMTPERGEGKASTAVAASSKMRHGVWLRTSRMKINWLWSRTLKRGVLCQSRVLPSGEAARFPTSSCLKVIWFTNKHVKNSTGLTLQKNPRLLALTPKKPPSTIPQSTHSAKYSLYH